MKLFIKAAILILIYSQLSFAGGITNGFEFLKVDFSPRTAAMSRSCMALRGDVNGMYLNPAGLIYLENNQFSFNYSKYLLDINGGSAYYAHRLEGIGVISIGILYMNYGTMDETNEFAEKTGNTFTANDMALGVGISSHLGQGFSYGVNLKYVFSKIAAFNASAVALDFGLIYDAPFEDDLYFAVTLVNLGSNFSYYAGVKEPLPLSMNVGLTKKLAHLPLELGVSITDINVEAEDILSHFKRFSIGGEFRLSQSLRLRLGYDNNLHNSLKTTSDQKLGGFSGGLGINWNKFRFDYSYSNYSTLGSIHRVGLQGSLD